MLYRDGNANAHIVIRISIYHGYALQDIYDLMLFMIYMNVYILLCVMIATLQLDVLHTIYYTPK